MKKALYTTSALAGLSLIAAAPAVAGEAPEVTFSGALAYESIFNDGDIQSGGTGYTIQANEQQSEFVWDARGVADNGLEYGANIQWRWAREGDKDFDEAALNFSGSWGRIYLGSEDGVEDLVSGTDARFVATGPWSTDGNNALRNTEFLGLNTATHYYQSATHFTGDTNKIGYISPTFAGFQVGISFSPDNSNRQEAGKDNQGPFGGTNVTSLAASWSGDIGEAHLKVDGSYGFGEDDSSAAGGSTVLGSGTAIIPALDPINPTVVNNVTITTANGPDREEIESYHVGGQVDFAGFSVAGSYFDNDDSGCAKTIDNCDAGSGYSIGAAYNFGAGAVSLTWQESEDDTDGNGRDDESEIVNAAVSYQVAEGLSTYLSAYWFDLDDEEGDETVGGSSNDATVVILGTRVTF